MSPWMKSWNPSQFCCRMIRSLLCCSLPCFFFKMREKIGTLTPQVMLVAERPVAAVFHLHSFLMLLHFSLHILGGESDNHPGNECLAEGGGVAGNRAHADGQGLAVGAGNNRPCRSRTCSWVFSPPPPSFPFSLNSLSHFCSLQVLQVACASGARCGRNCPLSALLLCLYSRSCQRGLLAFRPSLEVRLALFFGCC